MGEGADPLGADEGMLAVRAQDCLKYSSFGGFAEWLGTTIS